MTHAHCGSLLGLCFTLYHPALDYDRSPIVVLVNECALPARGERTFDDTDGSKVRRHHHHHRSSSTKSASDDDEPHTGFAALATGAPIQSTLMAKSGSASASVQMSSLAHADSSDSDDGVALPIDGNGLQVYRHELSPDLDRNTPSPSGAAQSRRLRKSPPNRAHGPSASRDIQLTNSEDSFASWSGSNSCLGGF